MVIGKRCTMIIHKLRKGALDLHHSWRGCYSDSGTVVADRVRERSVRDICGYASDDVSNVPTFVVRNIAKNNHLQEFHPINMIKLRTLDYFNFYYRKRSGNPMFCLLDQLPPIVSLWQNFDSLFIGPDHPSRSTHDTYYVNSDHVLRGHMTAHQDELIRGGFDNFLMAGPVFRRDSIDRKHYPIFHQLDGVRLYDSHDLFENAAGANHEYKLFDDSENAVRSADKQERLTVDATKLVEHNLKQCLEGLVKHLFGNDIQMRWVDAFFPFTHPSWELEIFFEDNWLEVLGCGVIEQAILERTGAESKVGWAFGLGLERLAMKLFDVPDIRLFWSNDPGFHTQFLNKKHTDPIKYVPPTSRSKPWFRDVSFWLPAPEVKDYCSNDFYELVREKGAEVVELVTLFDEFVHPKTGRRSHAYRIVYRHPLHSLSNEEVNEIHAQIRKDVALQLKVELRII